MDEWKSLTDDEIGQALADALADKYLYRDEHKNKNYSLFIHFGRFIEKLLKEKNDG